jgi:hypothetical protein
MPLSELAQALVRRGVITRDAGMEAEQRKQLYGGGLDTALLELRATDEETLSSHLSEIIGIPLLSPRMLAALPDPTAKQWIEPETAQKLGAAPFTKHKDALDVWVRPEHDYDALLAWSEKHTLLVEPFLVCEVRFRALLRTVYGLPVPPRYLALLAKLMGVADARKAVGDTDRLEMRTPTPVVAGVDPIDTFVAAARLGDAASRKSALRHLACRLGDHRVIELRRAFEKKAHDADPTVATTALQALTHLRDKNAVPAIIDLLGEDNAQIAAAAQEALVTLTCEDLGRKPKRWLDWWAEMGSRSRVEWLLEGLAHKSPELRLLASNELYEVCGEYFGYHYDLPEREREEARQRWMAWWQNRDAGPSVKGPRSP